MIGLMLINAFFDVLGLATIMVLIKSALESETITKLTYSREEAGSQIEYYFNETLRHLYQFLGAENEIELLFYLAIFIFIVFIIKNAISLWISYIQTRFAYNISLRLNKKMFKYYYDQGYLFIKDSSSGKKVYNIVDIPSRFASSYLVQTFVFSTELLVITIMCAALLSYRPLAVILLLVVVLPVFVLIYQFSKNKIRDVGYERNRQAPVNYARVLEAMKAYVDVKLSNRENDTLGRYEESQTNLNRTDVIYQGIYGQIHQKTNDIIFGLGILVIFSFAFFTSSSKDSVLTLLGFFGIAAYKVLPAINRMMNTILAIKNNSFVIDELKLVANSNLEKFEEVEKLPFESFIELDGISFTYPEDKRTVLNNISLKIKKGESLGIIGGSGSGKTTLLKLILRLILENDGRFRVDTNVLDTPQLNASFQRNVGYVEQDIFIMDGTLEENIAFGEKEIDYELLNLAIRDAMLDPFVEMQEMGIKMQLGEGGVKLSGGQKQRVGIARALYKQSEILVFDEATSALDPTTEKAIVDSINHLAEIGKTIIIVAHRITTLEKCDRIIELKNGSINREPLYSDLIKEIVETHQ